MRVVLYLFHQDAWQSLYGIRRNLVETTYYSKPIWYPAGNVESRYNGTETISSTFCTCFGSKCSGLLFIERFTLWYAISDFRNYLHYLNLSLCLLVGVNTCYHGLPLCALDQQPLLIRADCHCNCLRIHSGSLIFIRLWIFGMIFIDFMKT